MKKHHASLFTCPDCKAVFPPDCFCPFCGYKIPAKVILDHQMEVAGGEDRLNSMAQDLGIMPIRVGDSENCSPESHYYSSLVNNSLKDIPSDNGEIKFCQKCGKKLPEVP